jgi:CopG family transcriptional regulator, nickel-responsive regulator
MERITISIDDQLALRFDALIARRGYGSRSEAVRDLVREALEQERQQHADDTDSFGVLTYVYNHHERELASRISAPSTSITTSRCPPCTSTSTTTTAWKR